MIVSKANRNVIEAMTGNRRHRRIVSPALIIMDGSIAIGVVSGRRPGIRGTHTAKTAVGIGGSIYVL